MSNGLSLSNDIDESAVNVSAFNTTTFEDVNPVMSVTCIFNSKLDRVEASIIDTDDKNMYFMWGKIKRRFVKKDTFAWTNAVAAKQARCSKGDVKTIMKKLEKLGAIKCIQKGKSGGFTRRANLYRREV